MGRRAAGLDLLSGDRGKVNVNKHLGLDAALGVYLEVATGTKQFKQSPYLLTACLIPILVTACDGVGYSGRGVVVGRVSVGRSVTA